MTANLPPPSPEAWRIALRRLGPLQPWKPTYALPKKPTFLRGGIARLLLQVVTERGPLTRKEWLDAANLHGRKDRPAGHANILNLRRNGWVTESEGRFRRAV